MELLALLVALKLAFPRSVYLLRGNHETSSCTLGYGFKGEVDRKYSPAVGPAVQPPLAAATEATVQLPSTTALDPDNEIDIPAEFLPPLAKPHADAKV